MNPPKPEHTPIGHIVCADHARQLLKAKQPIVCCACAGREGCGDADFKFQNPTSEAPAESESEETKKSKLKAKLMDLNHKYNEPPRSERGCQVDDFE